MIAFGSETRMHGQRARSRFSTRQIPEGLEEVSSVVVVWKRVFHVLLDSLRIFPGIELEVIVRWNIGSSRKW